MKKHEWTFALCFVQLSVSHGQTTNRGLVRVADKSLLFMVRLSAAPRGTTESFWGLGSLCSFRLGDLIRLLLVEPELSLTTTTSRKKKEKKRTYSLA